MFSCGLNYDSPQVVRRGAYLVGTHGLVPGKLLTPCSALVQSAMGLGTELALGSLSSWTVHRQSPCPRSPPIPIDDWPSLDDVFSPCSSNVPQIGAQPPFLLRWSPQFFAKQAPAAFHHDPATNKLSLCPEVAEPWIRKQYATDEEHTHCWFY